MQKLAYAATFIGALGLAACGGGGGGDDDIMLNPDGGGDTADSGPDPSACNPVTQQGCESGEKCSWVIENPDVGLGRTACVPNGDVPAGGACQRDEASGSDNCQAEENVGYVCSGGVCTEVCSQTPSSTCSEGHCVLFNGLFDDVDNIGLCVPRCDTHLQNCEAETDACYMFIPGDSVDGICAGIPADAAELTQGDTCLKGQSGNCFLNGCAGGYGPELLADGAMAIDLCGYYCEPIETYCDSSGGECPGNVVGGPPVGNADAGGRDASCSTNTSGGGHHCRYIASSYNFGMNIDDTMIPKTIGFCAPTASDWGDCTTYDPHAIAQVASDAEANGEDVGMAIDTYCTDTNPAACAFGCVQPETLDTVFGARGMVVPEEALVPPHLRGKSFDEFADELSAPNQSVPGVQ